jgi:hypothetical protein
MNNYKMQWWFSLCLICVCSIQNAYAKKIHNRKYKFAITVPDQMMEIKDSLSSVQQQLYLDSSAGIVLIISTRKSEFKSVTDYLDCSKQDLENQLKNYYADSTLILISCDRPTKYLKQTTIVHFRVAPQHMEYNTNIIYFVHHKGKDIQFFFSYRQETEQSCQRYISIVMNELKLE